MQEVLVSAPSMLAAATDDDMAPAPARPTFREIFDQHAAAVGRTLRYLGVPEADLRDAAQEVFLVINRRHVEFEGRSSLATWIRQICVRVAFAQRRRQRRRREDVVERPPDRSVDADQHVDIERRQQRELLTRLLDTLDDGQRAVVVLHEIEMLPMREVAEAVGCPLQTAYSRRKAALERLRVELNRCTGKSS
jgi:RNA polymerase sigma-70 factor (ECF subfamily)